MRLAPEYHWVSVSVREIGPVGYDRHIIRKGAITTACGATASSSDVWQPNKSKPRCRNCVANHVTKNIEESGLVVPRKRTTKKTATPKSPKEDQVVPKTVPQSDLKYLLEALEELSYTIIDNFSGDFSCRMTKEIGNTTVLIEWDASTREWGLEFK